MSNKINVNQVEMKINAYLKDYKEDIDELVKNTTDKLTNRAKKDIKNKSPKDTGDYSKGWSVKTIKNAKTYTKKIWNPKKYRITHLLEFGHKVKRNGQIVGKATAIPHVRPVEEQYVKRFINEIEKGAKK